jgi:ATP-binding cassette subfamily F protein uup
LGDLGGLRPPRSQNRVPIELATHIHRGNGTFAGLNYLSVENISKSFGERTLFDSITFGISKGEKVALLARNGTGKSTLLSILSKIEEPDSGRVVFNKDIKVGFLAQTYDLDENKSILDNLFEGESSMLEAIREYENALLNTHDEKALQKASNAMDQHNSWDYEAKCKQILSKLGITDLTKPIQTLSGGQKRRIALAKVLIEEPDFLLLDEPTNHLDLDMIEWLEDFLISSGMTLLMVTHDRYFLEEICDHILELEDEQLYRYKGNYSYFLEKKDERETLAAASKEKAQNLMRRELVWMRTSPKARTTKSKYRQDQFKGLKKAATVNLEKDQMRLEINVQRLGSKTVEFHRVRKSYDDLVILDGFDYVFKRGERVGIAGLNGSGKTTFVRMLTGEEPVTGGKVVVGETVAFGHYSQSGLKFKDDARVLDVIRDIADVIPLTKGQKITAEQMLERFLFPRKMHRNLVSKLSGGEKKRLHLLTILMKNPNFLILDEPTNDLDVFTLTVLEDYLEQYPGILVIVSHDRFLLDRTCDHILVLRNEKGVKDITGNYTEWRRIQLEEEKKLKASQAKAAPKVRQKSAQEKTKLSFNEKYELEQLEVSIPELEEKKKAIETKLNSGEISDHVELQKLSAELGTIVSELDEKSDRWLELSEFA